MNDATPRRLSGSLLERAAAMYDFAPTPVSIAPDAPAPAFAPAATPVDPVVAETPSPQPEVAPARPVVRRFAPVDRDALAERGMLVPGGPVTPLGEEFRLVKRQLLLTARAVADTQPQKSRLVLVCSARPDDGKTFCAVNLALSMAAEKDVEVVLVDGDLVKPDVL
ncbi:MAG TPA: exopolysaccharide biosynthesis protein, partial [Sphingomonas sp.]|nr:exopolysaccharide biosynthesis protein [Sphingomonas sp.]